jgi:hypothetical protein
LVTYTDPFSALGILIAILEFNRDHSVFKRAGGAMKNLNLENQTLQIVDFSKASPEAIDAVLNALNSEVDRAVAQKRFPTLNGAFRAFGIPPSILQ